jgi:hypothetical protein
MEPLTLFRFLFIGGGLAVLATYLYMYRIYTTLYNDYEKRMVWAVWYNPVYGAGFAASVVLGAGGFCWFSGWVLVERAECDSWLLLGYVLFVLGACSFAPLVLFQTGKQWVIFGLFVTAASAVSLSAWAIEARATPAGVKVLMTWLAVHCTVLDLGLWGYTWYFSWHWVGQDQRDMQMVQGYRLEEEPVMVSAAIPSCS